MAGRAWCKIFGRAIFGPPERVAVLYRVFDFLRAAFLAAFFTLFLGDFLDDLAALGLTALTSCVPMGEPRPVQASQPDLAEKPPLLPEVMSLKAALDLAA